MSMEHTQVLTRYTSKAHYNQQTSLSASCYLLRTVPYFQDSLILPHLLKQQEPSFLPQQHNTRFTWKMLLFSQNQNLSRFHCTYCNNSETPQQRNLGSMHETNKRKVHFPFCFTSSEFITVMEKPNACWNLELSFVLPFLQYYVEKYICFRGVIQA